MVLVLIGVFGFLVFSVNIVIQFFMGSFPLYVTWSDAIACVGVWCSFQVLLIQEQLSKNRIIIDSDKKGK